MSINKLDEIKTFGTPIIYNGVKYDAVIQDNLIVIFNGFILHNLIHDDFIQFMSNKNIIVAKCKEEEYSMCTNIYNSKILIKKLCLSYESDLFEYNDFNGSLIEKTDEFDFTTRRNTAIVVEGYYLCSDIELSIVNNPLYRHVCGLLRGTNHHKIQLVHSNKFIGMEYSFNEVFDV